VAEDIVKLLSRPGSPSILVFLITSTDTQFQGELLHRGHQIHRGGKICDFRLKSPFISETVQDRPMVVWNINRKSYRYVLVPMTLSDLERRDVMGQFFSGGSP